MTYDPGTGLMVLFGGEDQLGNPLGDTWAYNFSSNKWSQRFPLSSPSNRTGIAMAYSDLLKASILVGAGDENWNYNVSLNQWSQRSSMPTQLDHIAAAYDSVHLWLYVMGGGWGGDHNHKTYKYDVMHDTWWTLTPQGGPGGDDPVLVYDRSSDRLVTYGGFYHRNMGTGGGNPLPIVDAMWSIRSDDSDWTVIAQPPLGREGAGAVWVPSIGGAFLYGGNRRVTQYDPSIFWGSNNTWTSLSANYSIYSRTRFGIAYDPKDDLVLLQGGMDKNDVASSGGVAGDLWSLNMSTYQWKEVYKPDWANTTRHRTDQAFAFHNGSGKLVMFGGSQDLDWNGNPTDLDINTSVIDPVTGTWTKMSPTDHPSARTGASMVYAESSKELLLFGGRSKTGSYLDDLWSYNLTADSWTQVLSSSGPSARAHYSMVYDPLRDLVLVFGGEGPAGRLNDTMYFSVKYRTWTQLGTEDAPSPRSGAVMFQDTVRDRYVLFGGFDGAYKCDTWVYSLDVLHIRGNYNSTPKALGGEAYFGNISWIATVPPSTYLRFQVRTGLTMAAMLGSDYLGPDGTNKTYYSKNGTKVARIHDGAHFLQYRAFMYSPDQSFGPALREVDVPYNLMHSVSMVSPLGGENLTGPHDIRWNASDPDGDALRFDVSLEPNSGAPYVIASGTSNRSVPSWDSTAYPVGMYRIVVVAFDDNTAIPLNNTTSSGWFNLSRPHINGRPTATLMGPANGTIVNGTHANLTWKALDPDGDNISYMLHVNSYLSGLMSSFVWTNTTTYELHGNGTYYWTVVPFDGIDKGTCLSGIWTVEFEPYVPPLDHPPVVVLLSPSNGSTLRTTLVNLSWYGSDPDGDPVLYNIYIGALDKVRSHDLSVRLGYTYERYFNTTLSEGPHYWTILAVSRGLNASPVSGPWSFTVGLLHPSVECNITDPASGATVSKVITVKGMAKAVDQKLLGVKLRIDGGAWEEANGTTSWNFVLDTRTLKDGAHTIEVKAIGDAKESSVVSVTLTVKNKGHAVTSVISPWIWILVALLIGSVCSVLTYRVLKDRHKKEGQGPRGP